MSIRDRLKKESEKKEPKKNKSDKKNYYCIDITNILFSFNKEKSNSSFPAYGPKALIISFLGLTYCTFPSISSKILITSFFLLFVLSGFTYGSYSPGAWNKPAIIADSIKLKLDTSFPK